MLYGHGAEIKLSATMVVLVFIILLHDAGIVTPAVKCGDYFCDGELKAIYFDSERILAGRAKGFLSIPTCE